MRGVKRVKANESAVFNRVVSRTLYSKKIVMAVMLATIMVGSAFVVSVSTFAGPTTSDKVNVKLEGWTLLPNPPGSPRWTEGDVKGYYEGDVVPTKLLLSRQDTTLTAMKITVGYEWGLGTFANPTMRGFDNIVKYSLEPPVPPYSALLDPDPAPWVANGATITAQTHDGVVSLPGGIWDSWTITLTFNQNDVVLRAGGLLYLTGHEAVWLKGASYFPGSSLHVGILGGTDLDDNPIPGFGTRSLPIKVLETLGPPGLVVEKSCRPSIGASGVYPLERIDFYVDVENTGQGDARMLSLVDVVTDQVGFVSGSMILWTSEDSTIVHLPDPDIDTTSIPDMSIMTWDFTDAELEDYALLHGTGLYGTQYEPLIVHFRFTVEIPFDAEPGFYENMATVFYVDFQDYVPGEPCLDPKQESASCEFTIVTPGISIEKWAQWDEPTQNTIEDDRFDPDNRVNCAAGAYDRDGDGVVEASEVGDSYWYVVYVRNPSLPDVSAVDMDFYVVDSLSGTLPMHPTNIGPGESAWWTGMYTVKGNEPANGPDGKFRNSATVYAHDQLNHKISDTANWDVRIYHPNLEITKVADREIVKLGETITYTVTIHNLGDVALGTLLVPAEVNDPMLDDTDPIWEGILAAGASVSIEVDYTVTIDTLLEIIDRGVYVVNTATFTGEDYQGHSIERSATEQVKLVTPDIEITKTAVNTLVGANMKVRYKITVENTGDTQLWFVYGDDMLSPSDRDTDWDDDGDVYPVDPSDPAPAPDGTISPWLALFGEFNAERPQAGGVDWWGILASQAKDIQYYDYTVQPGDIDPITGEVTDNVYVLGWHNPGFPENNWVDDKDDETVTVAWSLQGNVFHNRNLNNMWETATEEGLNSWSVELLYVDEFGEHSFSPARTVETYTHLGYNGFYSFDMLMPDMTYRVRETIIDPAKWFCTPPYAVTSGDLTGTGGGPPVVQDIGNAQYGSIVGWKYNDYNMNGERDCVDPAKPGYEPGIENWKVTLTGYYVEWDSATSTLIHVPIVADDELTDEDGYYEFTVKPGVYTVTEYNDPAWWNTEPGYPGDNPANAPRHANIEVSSGAKIPPNGGGKNFGNVPFSTVKGYKFYDKNGDGVQGDLVNEPGLNGFTIKLFGWTAEEWNTNPRPVAKVQYSVVTAFNDDDDKDGYFELTNVLPGFYTIIENPAPGWPGQAADWYITNLDDMDVDLLDIDEGADKTINVGDLRWAKIKVFKFVDNYEYVDHDSNQQTPPIQEWPDGVYQPVADGDHPYYTGWMMYLQPCDALGIPTGPIVSHVTNEHGRYTFTHVEWGYYNVWEEPMQDWVPTTPAKVLIYVPPHPWGCVIVKEIEFGNIVPDIDPQMSFTLQAGWNLWSVPMVVPGLTAMKLLSITEGAALAVTKMDKLTGDYASYVYSAPADFDFAIEPGEGYYIWSSTSVYFTLKGTLVPASDTVELVSGWNLVGFSQMRGIMASELLANTAGCVAYAITGLDPLTGEYFSYVLGAPADFDFEVTPGMGYYIWVDGAGQLSCA